MFYVLQSGFIIYVLQSAKLTIAIGESLFVGSHFQRGET